MKQKTKDLIKDLRIPDKPKKPLTPYFRYLSEHRSSVAQKNPGLKLTDVAKKCAEDWKSVDPAVKEKYDKEYKSELEKYTEKYLEYQAKLTDEQRSALKLASDEKRSEKQKRKLNKVRDFHYIPILLIRRTFKKAGYHTFWWDIYIILIIL